MRKKVNPVEKNARRSGIKSIAKTNTTAQALSVCFSNRVKKQIKKSIHNLPASAGVYFFFGLKNKLLYIGKAKNLKSRVGSYFKKNNNLSPAKKIMVQKIKKIKHQTTPSEIEALILEAKLIKDLKPFFNIDFRDDAFYPYIKITQEKFPRIFVTRKKIKDRADYFGPFISSKDAKLALQILRKVFPFRSCKNLPKRTCLDYHLHLCPGVCIQEKEKIILQKNREKIYQNNIKQIKKFLNKNITQSSAIIKELKIKMQKASQTKNYELAQEFLRQVQALQSIAQHSSFPAFLEKSTYALQGSLKKELQKFLKINNLPKRIEGYDISNIQGKFAVGSMVVFSLQKKQNYQADKTQYRRFKIKTVQQISDIAMLKEMLSRRLKHQDWPKPDLILIDGGRAQLNVCLKSLRKANYKIPVLALAKQKEEIYLVKRKNVLKLAPSSSLLKLLQSIRDEAHRFALSYYRFRHRKNLWS